MQVVFHLGAPCTDYDLLIKSLLKNRARLAYEGVAVPTPGRYRSVVRDTARFEGARRQCRSAGSVDRRDFG